MTDRLQRKLFIVRGAFAFLVLSFVVMTIWALNAAPSSDYVGEEAVTEEEMSFPDFAALPAVPSEENIRAALGELGVELDLISEDGLGYGTANGVPARIALGAGYVMFVDTASMEGRAACDGDGPDGSQLEAAWNHLVSYDGKTTHEVSEISEGVVTAGPAIENAKFWEHSAIAAFLEYGSSSCYFTASFPYAGELSTVGSRDMGTLDSALRQASRVSSSSLSISDFGYGYLPHVDGGASAVWYLEVATGTDDSGNDVTEWVSLPREENK